jgi:hypothetical protein
MLALPLAAVTACLADVLYYEEDDGIIDLEAHQPEIHSEPRAVVMEKRPSTSSSDTPPSLTPSWKTPC